MGVGRALYIVVFSGLGILSGGCTELPPMAVESSLPADEFILPYTLKNPLPQPELPTPLPERIAQTAETLPATVVMHWGEEEKAARIVFVFDHSGSMLDIFGFLRQNTIDHIQSLKKDQSFNIIMVSEKTSIVGDKLKVLPATEEFKKEVARKLEEDYRAQGQNDDLLPPFQEAFEHAFAMKPDLIIFITDGQFSSKLAEVVRKLNVKKNVRINTTAFVEVAPLSERQLEEHAKIDQRLQELTKENGGTHRYLTAEEVRSPD